MKRVFILSIIVLLIFDNVVSAQTNITNGDGSVLTTRYCHQDTDFPLMGLPSGGTFSGCGIRFENGQWLFNPKQATEGISVFPVQCPLTYTTTGGQSITKNLLIQKPVVIYPPLQDFGICVDTFKLDAQMLYAGAYEYDWSPSLSLERSDTNVTFGTIQQTTHFKIKAIDKVSGCMGFDSITVNRYPMPLLSVNPSETLIKSRKSVQLQAEGADYYSWMPVEGLSNPAISNPVAQPKEPTRYRVVGYNHFECTDTAYVNVDINETLGIPNAFTPNGDGKNDLFSVKNMGHQGVIAFKIFNRWGQLIFETLNVDHGWDGTHNSQQVEQGVYFYHIRIALRDGTVKDFKGDVTLIR